MAGERRRKCGWNGNDGKVEVCSEAREKERERKRVRERERERGRRGKSGEGEWNDSMASQ